MKVGGDGSMLEDGEERWEMEEASSTPAGASTESG
jgi:hypothetical protein